MAANMVAEQEGSAIRKLLWQRSWRLLSPSLVALRAVSSWVLLGLTFASRPCFFLFDLRSAPPSELNWRRGVAKRRHSIVYKNMFQISLNQF